jgi:penicillin-binding protein 1A
VWVGIDQPTTIIPHGYGAALALPVWVQVMNTGAKRYPPQALQPTMPIQRAMVCSLSNRLATTGCQSAGTAYDIDLPVDKIPSAACEIHAGDQMFARKVEDFGKKAADFPGRLFNTFRKIFGGR